MADVYQCQSITQECNVQVLIKRQATGNLIIGARELIPLGPVSWNIIPDMPSVGTGNSLGWSQSLLPIITDWKFGLWSREILDRVLDFWSVCYQQGAVMALTVEQDVLSIRSLLCARGIKICTITLGVHFSWRCWSSIVSVIICCWCLASIKEPPANQFQSQFLWMMGTIVAEAWRLGEIYGKEANFLGGVLVFITQPIPIYSTLVVFVGETQRKTIAYVEEIKPTDTSFRGCLLRDGFAGS